MRSGNGRTFVLLMGLLAALGLPVTAAAQDGFLFRPPVGGVTVRAGGQLYTVSGDLFEQLRQDLTLSRGDFRAPALNAELVFVAASRLDVVLGIGWSRTEARSEYRDLVEPDGQGGELPIEQTTRLRTVPLTASVRYQLQPRGRSVGQLVWLPRSTTPYVGAGVGATMYKLQQRGDFVRREDYSIHFDVIEGSGTHVTAHGMVGVDHWLSPWLGLNAEARYTRGRATPDRNQGYYSFDSVDLGGLQFTLGLSARW